MLIKYFMQKSSNLFVENRLLKFCVVLLVIMSAYNSYMTNLALDKERTIIVPTHIHERIEFEDGNFSDRYLEERVRDISSLAFNYSPATARIQYDRLLRYFAPEAYPSAHSLWYSLASRVETALVSSVFYFDDYKIDRGLKEIHIIGTRKQYSEDQFLSKDRKTYILAYNETGGQFQILSLLEQVQHNEAQKRKAKALEEQRESESQTVEGESGE